MDRDGHDTLDVLQKSIDIALTQGNRTNVYTNSASAASMPHVASNLLDLPVSHEQGYGVGSEDLGLLEGSVPSGRYRQTLLTVPTLGVRVGASHPVVGWEARGGPWASGHRESPYLSQLNEAHGAIQ